MSAAPTAEPIDTTVGPIGGQALLEGVMMRRGGGWGAAVRRTDGSITTTYRTLPTGLGPWRKVPLVRGIIALGESTVLGTQATMWAAHTRAQDPATTDASAEAGSDDGFSRTGLILSALLAIVLALGIFGLLPAVIIKAIGVRNPLVFSAAEGLLRLAVLVGYLGLLSRTPQVKRVFGYHGAEHMTIHAFEHRVPLHAADIRHFDRRHPRCGTAFLLVVVAVTIVAHALVGQPSWGVLILSRVLGLPVVAAIAYEAIRFAGLHQHRLVGRVIMAPGSWLQSITTKPPDDDMIEVAVAALEATLAEAPVPATAMLAGASA
ncbi:MAG TPA: DUF1385 domain-containing protein [Acidimicrobiales bacterium]